jgi:hypothetical protein
MALMEADPDKGTIFVSVYGQPTEKDPAQGMTVDWWDIDQGRWRSQTFRMPVEDMRYRLLTDYPERRISFKQA